MSFRTVCITPGASLGLNFLTGGSCDHPERPTGAYSSCGCISDIRLLLKIKSLPKSADSRRVFIAGGTGYIGSALIPILLEREHRVRVLVRPGSKAKLPAACEVVSGNALDANTYRQLIRPADTFIHLVGVPHPSPSKGAEFRAIDLVSAREAISACAELDMHHFIYLSVAHPAPMMKDYIAVRAECEHMIQERRLNATILRPWYVLGPGHRWPYALLPFYKICEWLPFTRAGALRLGLVTLDQLIVALVEAVESPTQGTRVVGVPEIRAAGLNLTRAVTRKTA
jgi:uncharacterized protein YbjT (DUF2867 family)